MFSLKNIQHFHLLRHLGYNFYDGNNLNICWSHIGLSHTGLYITTGKDTTQQSQRMGKSSQQGARAENCSQDGTAVLIQHHSAN